MSKTRSQPRRRRTNFVQKPNGTLSARVQAVGPEHFGIVMVDVAKADRDGVFFEAIPFHETAYRARTPLMHEIRRDGVTL